MSHLRVKTAYGTTVEVIRHLGCGDLLVRPLKGDANGVVNVDAVTPVNPADAARIQEIVKS